MNNIFDIDDRFIAQIANDKHKHHFLLSLMKNQKNAQNKYGNILFMAASYNSFHSAKYALQNNITLIDLRNSLYWARHFKYYRLFRLLVNDRRIIESLTPADRDLYKNALLKIEY